MALIQEFRFAARMLAKNKGWTAVALLALTLGLGANIAIFSVVGLMVWLPLPYPHAEQLVYIPQSNAKEGFSQAAVSLRDSRDWASASTIAAIATYQSSPMSISGQGEPQYLPAMQVTPEFFAVLGVQPALGRAFTAAETPERESRVAIISHELWQGTYRGDPGVLGREIRLDGRNYPVVGVLPEGFHYLYERPDVLTPLWVDASRRDRASRGLNNVARLKPGVTVAQAAAEVRSISERIEQEDPAAGQGWRGKVLPLTDQIIGGGAPRAAAASMFGAVGFVLLIACANVASLLLARGAGRHREFALRASLGASRGALIRLQLAESLLLSVAGGALGLVSAIWTIPLLKRIAPENMTFFQTAGLDWSALAYGLTLSVATGIVFGVVPAWLLTRGDLAPALRESGRGATGRRHLTLKSLVAAEIALALVLVAASTLMIRSLVRLNTAEVGFDRANLAAGRVLLAAGRYPGRVQITDFYARALDTLRQDGGVIAAALVQTIPLAGANSYNDVTMEGATDARKDNLAGDMIVSAGYFNAMGIPILAGRDFTEADDFDAPRVAVVNQTFLKRYWPKDSNPAGRRIKMRGEQAWITVVGLARDVRHRNPYDPPRPEVYRPHRQVPFRNMTLVARGRGGAQTAVAAMRAAVLAVDREQPLFRLQSMDALLARRQAGARATTDALGIMAVLALVLAAVGTYGVMSYTAAQRVREIGIRLALGAGRQDVFRMVLRGGLALAAAGLLIGLPAAYGVTPLLRAVNEGLDAKDGTAYGGVALMLFTVALVACVVPAWRAMRVDPATVLRDE